jgi:uncharacterized membrane protein YfcA
MSTPIVVLLVLLALVAIGFIVLWWRMEHARSRAGQAPGAPVPTDLLTGFVVNFFDALGIGAFAPTTAVFKLQRRMPDELIPGTLNAGHCLPAVAQAFIFTVAVVVDPLTLLSMIGAAVVGAWLGAGIVARLPRRAIQLGMGAALLVAAGLFLVKNLGWMPGSNDDPNLTATGLQGSVLVFAVAVNFLLGALMSLGIGLYAPCLFLCSLLGMNPLAAFPIMAGSCAFLMPVGGLRFVRSGRYHARAAIAMALGGVPAVFFAVYIVGSLPMTALRWLVMVVVLYAAFAMLRSRNVPAINAA